ncbi:hypothetical protein UFOVP239_37 [uncultured Caudovirales phage]|uniref:Uncharacterized protein n=1 Tax=uncultured Caudovirales phage TaxID=2100421 RepID=A0A6J7WTL5_9CAUD|nr:hypothetical protein UFOVP239_37 [uncultured Caudovirales phage]
MNSQEGPIIDVDAMLKEVSLPTYTETMSALRALAYEVGLASHVDTHVVYKAWVLLDRFSNVKQKRN